MVHDAIKLLVDEYIIKLMALDNEFRAKVTAVAWGVMAQTLSSAFAGGLPPEIKRLAAPQNLNGTHSTPPPKGPKKDVIEALLASKIGKWVRRGGNNVYICDGPDSAKYHYKMHLEGNEKQVIVVKLATILSGWKHIP